MRTVRDAWASQREFDLLRQRVDQMDQHGTRGVGTLQVRIDELIKDLSEMKIGYAEWQVGHLNLHKQETDDARNSRRFILTTTLTVLGLVIALLALSIGHLVLGH